MISHVFKGTIEKTKFIKNINRFYFTSSITSSFHPIQNSVWGDTEDTVWRYLSPFKKDTGQERGTNIDWTATKTFALDRVYVSDPLAAQDSVTWGSITGQIFGEQGLLVQNTSPSIEIYIVDRYNTTIRGTVLAQGRPRRRYIF